MNFKNELYYISSIANISSILQHGLLSNEAASKLSHISVADQDVQNRREKVRIPNGLRLHQYVNLYFDARNPMMYRIMKKRCVSEMCVLIVNSNVLYQVDVVIADRNASSDYVSFESSPGGLQKVDLDTVYCEDWTDNDQYKYYYKKSTKCAEVLVPHRISIDSIIGALVGNIEAKNTLVEQGFSLTITMNPRMFFSE